MPLKDMQHYSSRMNKIKQAVYKGAVALSLIVMSAGSSHAALVPMKEPFGGQNLLLDTSALVIMEVIISMQKKK